MKIRHHFFSSDNVRIPSLLSMGCSSDTRITRFGPSSRNVYLIHYVVSGKGYFNGHPVEAGKGFLISPRMFEHYYPDENDPWTYLWIISDDPVMDVFFRMYNPNTETGIFSFRNKYVVENIIARMELETDPTFFSTAQLTEWFLNIYNNCINVPSERAPSSARRYYDFSVSYINSNLHLEGSVDELCRRLGISQPYLYKIFKEECGRSPKQYILDRKLLYAEQLLSETDFTVSEVATSVGFSDPLCFSRFFSKRTGLSPTVYRKEIRQR